MDDFEIEIDELLPRMPLSSREMVMLTPEGLKAVIDEAVAEAVAAENETCAKVAERIGRALEEAGIRSDYCWLIATNIRARKCEGRPE